MENGATVSVVAQAVINPAFGRSITDTTLRRHFHKEVALLLTLGSLTRHSFRRPGNALRWIRQGMNSRSHAIRHPG